MYYIVASVYEEQTTPTHRCVSSTDLAPRTSGILPNKPHDASLRVIITLSTLPLQVIKETQQTSQSSVQPYQHSTAFSPPSTNIIYKVGSYFA